MKQTLTLSEILNSFFTLLWSSMLAVLLVVALLAIVLMPWSLNEPQFVSSICSLF